MEFAKLRRSLAESGIARRIDEMFDFITYREVRELRIERADIALIARRKGETARNA
jgi:hypothetical protein